jgi:polar amino acid transport system substrate-binding protein
VRHTRLLRLLALSCLLMLLAGACSKKKTDLGVNEKGKLVVCSDIPYAPMELEGKGPDGLKYTGFDIDLLNAIAKTKDLKLEVKDVDFDGILGKLTSGDCDVVGSSLSITPARKKQVRFSDPYFDADQSLLVKSDSSVKKLNDLAGKTIGVQSATTGKTYAQAHKPSGATVKDFADTPGLFAALESNDVAAVLQDLVVNQDRATKSKAVKVVETYKTDEKYGFAIEKNNKNLTKAVDDGLKKVRDDGTYTKLYNKYFPKTSS